MSPPEPRDEAPPFTGPAWSILGLTAGPDGPATCSLVVTRSVCGRTGFLHGGCSLGAAVTAMEAVTGRPLAWATGQFLARAALGETVTYTTTVSSHGRRLSQATVEVAVGERVVTRVIGALGGQPGDEARTWLAPPTVDPPEACPPAALSWEPDGSFHSTAEARTAVVDRTAGRVALWLRLPGGLHATAAGLAVLADYVPTGFRLVLDDVTTRASSLDVTLRITSRGFRVDPGRWVLLELVLGALAGGIAHGDALVWTPSGRLLALASQTFAFSS